MTDLPAIQDQTRRVRPTAKGPMDAVSTPWGYALLVICLFFVVGGAFAYQAPLATSIIATGQVVAEGERRAVQSPDAGTIVSVAIQDGSRVEIGDVVIKLDTADLDLRLDATVTRLRQIAAREARLLAERDAATAITWAHSSLSNTNDPGIQNILAAEQRLFNDRVVRRENQKRIIERRIAQLYAQIEGEELVLASHLDRRDIVDLEISDIQNLFSSGLTTRARLLSLQREEAELRGRIGETQAAIASLQQRVGEAEIQISELRTAFLEEVSTAYPAAQGERAELEDQYGRLSLSRERRNLRASVDGRIIGLKHTGPGPVVGAGEVLFEIVPDQDGVVIETAIRPSDIEAVTIGMEARVVFSALALQEARSTVGTVSHVAPDVVTDEATGQQFFEARVSIAEEKLAEDVPNLGVVIGMPTEVYILSGERTLLQYLAEPIQQVLDRGLRE